MDGQEIFRGERFARVGLGAVLVDVLLDKTLLVNNTCNRSAVVLREALTNFDVVDVRTGFLGHDGLLRSFS